MTSNNSYAVEAEGLVKSFGDTPAVQGLDLTVPEGGVVGLLGPNCAGKITTVRMLATLLRPDTGTARLAASLNMGERALLKIRRAPEQTADAILLPVIFTLLFTYLFGGALAGSTATYLQDLLPGRW